jgi:protein disulfide-isomerase/thiol:disulfide interchange protein DsbC
MRRILAVLIALSTALFGGSLYEQLIKEQIRSIPLDKAIVVGKGEKKLIAFINPDCPHCRAEWKELRKHLNKVTIYIFVFPFKAWGEDNLRKSYYIACSENKLKALDEVLLGKLDGNVPKVEKCDLVDEHLKVVEKMGVTGVPYNILPEKNKIIEGFSENLLKELGIKK